MKCPFCNNIDTKVLNTRVADNGSSVKRRRLCEFCNKRFTTYEKMQNISITVVKRDGSKEPFDEAKLMNGLMLATEKRNVSHDILENIVARVQKFAEESDYEILSIKLGDMVMDELKKIDVVGYLRFASVYKNFENLENFMQEIKQITKKKRG